jgi:hypothetical protein
MSTIKRTLLALAVLGGSFATIAPQADAGIIFRGGPVRRVAARAVLPPYPVARRAVVGPVYRPYYRPVGYGYRPGFYGPGVSVGVGIY